MTSIAATPSLLVAAAARQRREFALVALLIGEILYLTVTFDTQSLERIPSAWTRFLGWSPQYLRIGISVTVLTLLLGGRRFIAAVTRYEGRHQSAPLLPLAVHAGAFVGLIWVSGILFAAGSAVAAHPGRWTAAWCLSGAVLIGSWALAVFPADHWRAIVVEHRRVIGWGIAAGLMTWASGFLTEGAWTVLARYTFGVVTWMLRAIYPDVVSQPDLLRVGTSTFRVVIAPACSGYKGVGLILTFLGIYLFLFRKELRFPGALVLLPIGAVAIWILNAVRIVALIVIGSSGWREVALGGFHSQTGWLVFNAVGLTFVAAISRGGYFTSPSRQPTVATASEGIDSTTAFLGPFVAMLAAAMVTRAFAAGLDWLYPVRIAVAAFVIWRCWPAYANLRWSGSFGALAIGIATFVVWMAMLPGDLTGREAWPAALQSSSWGTAWLVWRVIGYVAVAPLAEELAFRGYATRRLIRADIDRVPVGAFSWLSFVGSSLLFGALHGRLWFAGTVAGLAFACALYRRRSFGDAVLAHATTNGLIACYVLATGRWSVWS